MSYIFMDESGDLGFKHKQKTSNNFIITFLFTSDKKNAERIIRSIFATMPKKLIKHHYGTLHAHREHPATKIKLLKKLSTNNDSIIMIIRLNKKAVYTELKRETVALYNYVTNILLDRVFTKKLIPLNDKIIFI